MFNKPRNNVVESSEGFYVEVLGRTGIKYVEGLRAVFIDSEVLMGPEGMMVHENSITNWQVLQGNLDDDKRVKMIRDAREVSLIEGEFLFKGFKIDGPVDENKRNKIVENVRRAFLFEGFDIVIV